MSARHNTHIDTLTEIDAVTMRRRQNETQPSKAPRGLRFGWLVDQYMSSLSSVYYGERGANTRGNDNNLANGGFIEMNLFKATSCYMH